ncbi:7350_t:CDS:2, partial [Dentiscutata heterogama]
IAELLKVIIMQNSTSIQVEFCYLLIKETLNLESYLERYNTQETLLDIEDSNIQEQIILLRKVSYLSSDILPNKQIIQILEEKINTFNKLMINQLLDINQKNSDSLQTINNTNKRKKTIESDEVTIQIPGFSDNISTRKLQTYTTFEARLVKLLG